MGTYRATFIKLRCDPCLGWGRRVIFSDGERIETTCQDCDGTGWVETRLLVLVEREAKLPKHKKKSRPHWSQLGVGQYHPM